MRHIIKSNIFILLLIALLITILPMPVQADEVNHGRVDSGGRTGHGSNDWAYTETTGIRIGIYFVEGGAEKFADPTATVYKIGKPTDFAKSVLENVKSDRGYDYTIKIYTKRSVFTGIYYIFARFNVLDEISGLFQQIKEAFKLG